MRVATRTQQRLDCTPVSQVQLNTHCRHEMIPFLRTLQHIYSRPKLREQILKLVAEDVNAHSSPDLGREGMTYWQILVLASARLELNSNYDALQDLAEDDVGDPEAGFVVAHGGASRSVVHGDALDTRHAANALFHAAHAQYRQHVTHIDDACLHRGSLARWSTRPMGSVVVASDFVRR